MMTSESDAVKAMDMMTTISWFEEEGGGGGEGVVSGAPSSALKPHVADAYFDKEIRIVVLIVEVIAGTIGGAGAFLWLWTNWKRRSRVNVIIFNVNLTDLLVVCFACGMQLVWELVDREWKAGDAVCRVLKWGQSFAIMSSNNMLIVLSVDRHQAIRSPLRKPISVMKMVGFGWLVGGLLSLPQLFVFRKNFVTAEGIFQNKTVCESIFRERPPSHRQAYLTYVSLVVFYFPLAAIVICYVRIYLKIAEKADDGKTTWKKSEKPGKIRLQSTKSGSLPKAKVKTLRMTVVIVSCFILCGLPYHILEAIMSFGDHTIVSGSIMAVMGAMAVANSAINPFVFLLFNSSKQCMRRLVRCGRGDNRGRSQNFELRSGGGTSAHSFGFTTKSTSIPCSETLNKHDDTAFTDDLADK